MPLITLENACLAFGHHALLDGADLILDAGERVGLIGRNGAGKSSLFRVLSKASALDDGNLWQSPGLRLAYVDQEPSFESGLSVFDEVSKGLGEVRKILLDYHAVSHQLSEGGGDTNFLLEKLHELQVKLEAEDGWSLQSKVETAIRRLDLPEDALISSLSGGQRKRVALAQALVYEPDVLLLDEPTNHLDFSSIEWLEEFLVSFGGCIFFITHDRRFLDNVATRIVELDRGKLISFEGNFSRYLVKKAEMLEIEEIHAQKFDKILAQEEVWIRKGIQARRTRNEGRVRKLEALRIERAKRREAQGKVSFVLEEGEKSGKLVAELTHVRKTFGNLKVVDDFSCRILRGDKIGLLGPNGAGKSTLLKLVLGQIPPDSGAVRLGTKLEVAYFDQLRENLDLEATLVSTISQGGDFVEINGEKKHVISYLGDFLFSPERARSPVKSLSGGERNRLLLARLFTRPVNVLILDEPTNDLDIETLELLESLLQDYSGTLFLVSHDRAFLDNVVTQVIAAEGGGKWREYVGGYEDWVRARKSLAPAQIEKKSPVANKPKATMKASKELEKVQAEIEKLEAEQKELERKLADPSLYSGPPEKAKEIQQRFAQVEAGITDLLGRWEELERV